MITNTIMHLQSKVGSSKVVGILFYYTNKELIDDARYSMLSMIPKHDKRNIKGH